jgi:hypothetical protein
MGLMLIFLDIQDKPNRYVARYQVIGMRPMVAPYEDTITNTDLQSSIEDVTKSGFEGVREQVISELPTVVPSPSDNVAISCLGTGSAMPGKYRNGKMDII